MTARAALLSGRRAAMLLYVAAWLPVAVVTLHLRSVILQAEGEGFDVLSALHGLPSAADIPWHMKLMAFRDDVFVFVVLVPLLLSCVIPVVSKRARVLLCVAPAIALLLVLFVQLKAFWEVRSYLPIGVLAAGMSEANREHIAAYLSMSSLVRLVLMAGVTLVTASIAAWFDRDPSGDLRALPRNLRRSGLVLLPVGTGLYLLPAPDWAYQRSDGLLAVSSFLSTTSPAEHELPGEPRAIVAEMRELHYAGSITPTPVVTTTSLRNIIFVVLETAPDQCVRQYVSNGSMPHLKTLADGGYWQPRHYSTYPYTTRALFSIYSGWYPSAYSYDFVRKLSSDENAADMHAPGIVQQAQAHGFSTAIAVPEYPVDNWERDQERYQALGFDEVVSPPREQILGWREELTVTERRELADSVALDLADHRLRDAIDHDERLLLAFHPQVTHAPWPSAESANATLCDRGADVFAKADAMIGQLIQTVREHGAWDSTLWVVTGDHGIRTWREHRGFIGGTITELTYAVPFVIRDPRGDFHSERQVSSHVDIAPTIADLMGFQRCRDFEIGQPLQASGAHPRVYLFGRDYLGADGFLSGDTTFVVRYATDSYGTGLDSLGLSVPVESLHPLRVPADRAGREEIERLSLLQANLGMSMVSRGALYACPAA